MKFISLLLLFLCLHQITLAQIQRNLITAPDTLQKFIGKLGSSGGTSRGPNEEALFKIKGIELDEDQLEGDIVFTIEFPINEDGAYIQIDKQVKNIVNVIAVNQKLQTVQECFVVVVETDDSESRKTANGCRRVSFTGPTTDILNILKNRVSYAVLRDKPLTLSVRGVDIFGNQIEDTHVIEIDFGKAFFAGDVIFLLLILCFGGAFLAAIVFIVASSYY